MICWPTCSQLKSDIKLCKRHREHYIASDKVALAQLAEMISSPGKHVALCSDDQAVFAAGSSVAGGEVWIKTEIRLRIMG